MVLRSIRGDMNIVSVITIMLAATVISTTVALYNNNLAAHKLDLAMESCVDAAMNSIRLELTDSMLDNPSQATAVAGKLTDARNACIAAGRASLGAFESILVGKGNSPITDIFSNTVVQIDSTQTDKIRLQAAINAIISPLLSYNYNKRSKVHLIRPSDLDKMILSNQALDEGVCPNDCGACGKCDLSSGTCVPNDEVLIDTGTPSLGYRPVGSRNLDGTYSCASLDTDSELAKFCLDHGMNVRIGSNNQEECYLDDHPTFGDCKYNPGIPGNPDTGWYIGELTDPTYDDDPKYIFWEGSQVNVALNGGPLDTSETISDDVYSRYAFGNTNHEFGGDPFHDNPYNNSSTDPNPQYRNPYAVCKQSDPVWRVFATSDYYTGNLVTEVGLGGMGSASNGSDAADLICQSHSQRANAISFANTQSDFSYDDYDWFALISCSHGNGYDGFPNTAPACSTASLSFGPSNVANAKDRLLTDPADPNSSQEKFKWVNGTVLGSGNGNPWSQEIFRFSAGSYIVNEEGNSIVTSPAMPGMQNLQYGFHTGTDKDGLAIDFELTNLGHGGRVLGSYAYYPYNGSSTELAKTRDGTCSNWTAGSSSIFFDNSRTEYIGSWNVSKVKVLGVDGTGAKLTDNFLAWKPFYLYPSSFHLSGIVINLAEQNSGNQGPVYACNTLRRVLCIGKPK